jgi:hypothetical protein
MKYLSLVTSVFVFSALAACHHRDDKNATPEIAPKDARLLKAFEGDGKWFCPIFVTYSEAERGRDVMKTETLIALTDDGIRAKAALTEACEALDESLQDQCRNETETNTYSCVHPSLFISKYPEISESRGPWVCEMTYDLRRETVVLPESTPKKPQAAAPKPAPSASPSPAPAPSPTIRVQITTKKFETEAETSIDVVNAAFAKCVGFEDEIERRTCAQKILGLGMSCWNKDLGKNPPLRKRAIRR